ncbi:Spindle-pole body protein [Zalerion maritima]|uniref:Spindle-pole body protein n=1 Tax=Zalerion maritima TaxID=339359 RepID=A0AAD5RUW2_9PEZI|nr:Spindle-pole body protein [Zalerion maritima]
MVRPDETGLDTPRTALGDATYMSRAPDFDMSIEPSFYSPNKGGNLLDQLRNGRAGGISLRTPRGGSRAPLNDVRNLPAGIGGPEFTPLLKSATRNSAMRYGKENGAGSATPAALGMIDEDMTPVPAGDASMFNKSTSYADTTYPEADTSSATSTPFALPARRGEGKGPLQDGNQLSLREQENVIDKIEKENFGLKLKIHFLEEALRKAGPGYSEAALKENTELKVDKVTMQREIQKYKKHLSNAEKDIEDYQQRMLDMHERMKRKQVDESMRLELDRVRQSLEDREVDIEDMQRELDTRGQDQDKAEKLQDVIDDLEADIRRKEELNRQHEDDMEDLRLRLKEAEDKAADSNGREADVEELENEVREKDRTIRERDDELGLLRTKLDTMETKMKDSQRKMGDLADKAAASNKLEEAKETIGDLETDVRELENQVEDLKENLQHAIAEKDRAENDLDELQDELSNKSLVTKGLSRQIEQKVVRLQDELDQSNNECAVLETQLEDKQREYSTLKSKVKSLQEERDSAQNEQRQLLAHVEELKDSVRSLSDERSMYHHRYEALSNDSTSMQREISRLEKTVRELEDGLDNERTHSLEIERTLRVQHKAEIAELQDETSKLRAEIREKDNLYDIDSDKWDSERHSLESERRRAVERADGLQRTIEKLREAEGSLSNKEQLLQEALDSEAERHKSEQDSLNRQITSLRRDLEQRLSALTDLRKELSCVRDELRQTMLDHQTQLAKVEGLEDDVEVLQSALEGSDSAQQELAAAKQECASLKQQLQTVKLEADIVRSSKNNSIQAAKNTSESMERLQSQLSESTASLAAARRERQSLQDQLAKLNLDQQSLKSALANTTAERDELASELKLSAHTGEETVRLDAERIELRTARTKLESEVRRLREENRALDGARSHLEKTLEEEIEKAAEEEDRLANEIRELQIQTHQARPDPRGESQELSAAKRTVRDLERKVLDLEAQLSVAVSKIPGNEGNSELSLIRRDLSSARQKELDFASKEAQHRNVVKGLKKQIMELERRAYEAELSKIMDSTAGSPSMGSATKREVGELRNQLAATHKALGEAKAKVRETEKKALAERTELEAQIDDLEEVRATLEERVEDVTREAQEASEKQEKVVRKLKARLEKMELAERQNKIRRQDDETMTIPLGKNERRELMEMLRAAQEEAERLAKDVKYHQSELEAFASGEINLRKKLERARNERAKYREGAEKMARDSKKLKYRVDDAEERAVMAEELAEQVQQQVEDAEREKQELIAQEASVDAEAIVRAAEQAQHRHQKELRGMALQMEWMQARWQREASLRSDAAYAKRFVQLQLDIAEACNKADLRVLNQIHQDLGLPPPSLPEVPGRKTAATSTSANSSSGPPGQNRLKPTLKTFAIMFRFIARASLAAKDWQKQEKVRQKLEEKVQEMRRTERAKRMRRSWREEREATT